MNSYVMLAYISGLALLWGYALALFLEARALSRRRAHATVPTGGRP